MALSRVNIDCNIGKNNNNKNGDKSITFPNNISYDINNMSNNNVETDATQCEDDNNSTGYVKWLKYRQWLRWQVVEYSNSLQFGKLTSFKLLYLLSLLLLLLL